MKINSIYAYYNSQDIQNNKKQKNSYNSNINFMAARVEKSLERICETYYDQFPVTLKNFIDSLTDRFKFTPLEALREAFIDLKKANTVRDVKEKFFEKEELFKDLKDSRETKATTGILGIYREFKDIYPNGILKGEKDLSVYILKKKFLEAKTIDEINQDLEEDLVEDIKTEFKRRNKDSNYLCDSTLDALGIRLLSPELQNSLRYTREGYSDEVGAKISKALLDRWNALSEEEKFEILTKRCEGRDSWWNSLSYNEKLELAAKVDSEEDLYRSYKRFVRAKKKEIKEGTFNETLERPTKKIRVGNANLKDIDIFNLWFKKNIEKFYTLLSEADKDSVHIKRVRKLAVRWQEMTPEERTELINKMREGREPLRYAMIDTWNHSRVLIRELSDFLSAQQILKPVDMLYESKEFSEFQSKIMTEFWASHKDLAEEFGKNLKRSIERVEDAIQRGQFEDLKQEILRDRAYRIKLLNHEKTMEEQALKEAELKKAEELAKTADNIDYKEDFKEWYKKRTFPENILPPSYINEMTDVIINSLPKNIIEEMTYSYKHNTEMPKDILEAIKKAEKSNTNIKAARMQRALEAAVANELYAKGYDAELFSYQAFPIIEVLSKLSGKNLPKNQYPDAKRIEKLYNEYNKDLSEQEVKKIRNDFFIFSEDSVNNENVDKILTAYIQSYGRSALILFSDKSAFPNEVKIKFNTKFLELLPEEIQDFCFPIYQSSAEIIEEGFINEIKSDIAKRFEFLPKDFVNEYTQEVARTIRFQKAIDSKDKETFSIKNYKEKMCNKTRIGDNDIDPIILPKYTLSNEGKMKYLAAEQALADELFRVLQDESVYSLSLENLCFIFETYLSEAKFNYSDYARNKEKISLIAKSKLNKAVVYQKYHEYLEELKDRANDIFDEEKEIIKDKTELMYALNPETNNPERDEMVLRRIEEYAF